MLIFELMRWLMDTSDIEELSKREKEILLLVARGASNKEIAKTLYISINTVKVHLRNIFTKIGVNSRTEAAMFAVNTGLISGSLPSSVSEPEPNTVQVFSTGEATLADKSPKRLINTWLRQPRGILVGGIIIILLVAAISITISWFTSRSTSNPVNGQIVETTSLGWKNLPSLPEARYGLALVAYEDRLYAIGGMANQGVSGQLDIFEITRDTWGAGKPKPLAVQDIQAVIIRGKLYVPGGLTDDGLISDRLEIYDPRQDAWTTGAPLPVPVSAYALAAFNNRMYLFGGWDGTQILDTVYEYNPEMDEWKAMPSMPTARRYLGAVVSGNAIFVVGGEGGQGPLDTNEIFYPDQITNPQAAWQPGELLPEPVYGMGVTSVADIIYLVAGQGEAQREYPVLAYEKTEGWRVIEAWPGEVATFPGLTSQGVFLSAVGGMVDNLPTSDSYKYQALYTVSFPLITK